MGSARLAERLARLSTIQSKGVVYSRKHRAHWHEARRQFARSPQDISRREESSVCARLARDVHWRGQSYGGSRLLRSRTSLVAEKAANRSEPRCDRFFVYVQVRSRRRLARAGASASCAALAHELLPVDEEDLHEREALAMDRPPQTTSTPLATRAGSTRGRDPDRLQCWRSLVRD